MAAVGLDPCLRSHRVLAQGSAACLGPPATSLFGRSAWGRVPALQARKPGPSPSDKPGTLALSFLLSSSEFEALGGEQRVRESLSESL